MAMVQGGAERAVGQTSTSTVTAQAASAMLDAAAGRHAPASAPDAGRANTVVVDGKPRRIFFLRGHMRSGTNWMGSLLSLHPKVAVDGEFHLEMLKDALNRFTTETWSMGSREPIKTIAEERFQELVRRTVATVVAKKPGAEWLCDKTPAPNDRFLPGAPNLVIVRDGRDVATSWTFHQLRIGGPFSEPHRTMMAGLRERFKADPNMFAAEPHLLFSCEEWVRACGRGWARYIRNHLETIERSRKGDFDGPILLVHYERLHEDPEGQRAAMYRFLGLNPDEARPLSEKTKTVPGFGREDPNSFYRKGEVGDWKNYVTDDFRRWFKDEAGEMLVAMGYERDGNW